ncbi:MAG: DegT/DnrJ/EryC1/StrS family aminotransferase [Bacteroidota bacterium]|nr:DegT/DnrJ/EryC1/StrS family aminotransferase [Bacteroidota bacterium]
MEKTIVKPKVQHELEFAFGQEYGLEEAEALMQCLKERAPSCGKKVKEFEDAFATYTGSNFALSLTSATTGLKLAGIAVGVQAGDEVITTPISWISTATAFSELGAKIVFCDVDPFTLNLDPIHLEHLITSKTKAIVPVHLYGQCCKMDEIMKIAQKHKIAVIEDCSHNPGGTYLGKPAGTWGDIGIFSFQQQKNISTLGEGGMAITNNKSLFDSILSYRSLCCRIYGGSEKYLAIDEEKYPMDNEYWKLYFDDIGFNYRMTDAQATVGIQQLKKLDNFNNKRKEIADYIRTGLKGIKGLTLPYEDPNGTHVYHIFMIQIEKEFPMSKRDFMYELYFNKGIKVWSHYMPIHLTHPYLNQGHFVGECAIAEAAYQKYVSLPIHPRLAKAGLDYLIQSIKELAA